MKTVGEIIRERRETLNLTLQQVADETGLTKSYLSMIENHKVDNPPSIGLLEALERALGISGGELLRAAAWERTPEDVKQRLEAAEEKARRGEELAAWLKESTKKGAAGGGSGGGGGSKNLDQLFKSGELAKRVNAMLKDEDDDGGPGPKSPRQKKPAPKRGELDKDVPVRVNVPLINKMAAGYPTDFTDLGYPARVADEYVSCPDIADPNAFAARVSGESMLPDYREGDIVVFSPAAKVTDGSDCFVRLEPDHESTFKRVYFETEKGQVRLQPLNSRFAPRNVERVQIAGLYKAVYKIQKLGE